MPKYTTEEFIQKAIEKHGDKYDYSKTIYLNSKGKVIIICKIHDEFEQEAGSHMRGIGCPKCSGNHSYSTEEYIQKAIEKHGDKYDYSKTIYLNSKGKVIIICKIHGDFEQLAAGHLQGYGCLQCQYIENSEQFRYSTEEYIQKAIEKHGDKYDYSKTVYLKATEKVTITCKIHDDFDQLPSSHLQGIGCPKCRYDDNSEKFRYSNEEYIQKAIEKHGDKYDYSKTVYLKATEKVTITCKIHDDFEQQASSHLRGIGCPKCGNAFSKVEIEWLNTMAKYHNVTIQHAMNDGQYIIPGSKYKADGYCQETNTIYEFNGDIWHGNPRKFKPDEQIFYGKTFGELYENTITKENFIKEQGFNLVVIWEDEWKNRVETLKLIKTAFKP